MNTPALAEGDADAQVLHAFGYKQALHRSMGRFSSFAVSFSLISLTTGIFANYGFGLNQAGPRFIWTWLVVGAFMTVIALVFAHISTQVPIAGYSYQWATQLRSRRFGWFPGWFTLAGWWTSTAGVAYAFSSYFAPYVGLGTSNTTIVATTVAVLLICGAVHIVGISLAAKVNNVSVATELAFAAVVGVGLLIYTLVHHTNSIDFLSHHGTLSSTGTRSALAISVLMGVYSLSRVRRRG